MKTPKFTASVRLSCRISIVVTLSQSTNTALTLAKKTQGIGFHSKLIKVGWENQKLESLESHY